MLIKTKLLKDDENRNNSFGGRIRIIQEIFDGLGWGGVVYGDIWRSIYVPGIMKSMGIYGDVSM